MSLQMLFASFSTKPACLCSSVLLIAVIASPANGIVVRKDVDAAVAEEWKSIWQLPAAEPRMDAIDHFIVTYANKTELSLGEQRLIRRAQLIQRAHAKKGPVVGAMFDFIAYGFYAGMSGMTYWPAATFYVGGPIESTPYSREITLGVYFTQGFGVEMGILPGRGDGDLNGYWSFYMLAVGAMQVFFINDKGEFRRGILLQQGFTVQTTFDPYDRRRLGLDFAIMGVTQNVNDVTVAVGVRIRPLFAEHPHLRSLPLPMLCVKAGMLEYYP